MKKRTAPIAVAIAAAAAVGAWFGTGGRPGKGARAEGAKTIAVDSVAAVTGVGNYGGLQARYAGIAETQEEWGAKTEGERKVKKTFVKAGDSVKAGDPLFEYDVAADEQAIEKDRIALDRFANDIESRKRRIEQLRKQEAQAKTQEELLSTQTQILQEENSIKQDEYEARTAQADMDALVEATKESTVRSEIDGVVKKIGKPDSGSEDSSFSSSDDDGDQNFVTIAAADDLRVKGYANEQNVDAVSEGDRMIAFSRTGDGSSWRGVVTAVKRDGDDSKKEDSGFGYGTGTSGATKYPFYVELDVSEGLKLGQHVYLETDVGQADGKEGLWLYDYYIQEDDLGTFVWAESKDGGTIERRAVATGEKDEAAGKTKIESGLGLTDKIAVPGQDPEEGMPTAQAGSASAEDESEWDEWNAEWRGLADDGAGGLVEDDGWADDEWTDDGWTDVDEWGGDDEWTDDGGQADGADGFSDLVVLAGRGGAG